MTSCKSTSAIIPCPYNNGASHKQPCCRMNHSWNTTLSSIWLSIHTVLLVVLRTVPYCHGFGFTFPTATTSTSSSTNIISISSTTTSNFLNIHHHSSTKLKAVSSISSSPSFSSSRRLLDEEYLSISKAQAELETIERAKVEEELLEQTKGERTSLEMPTEQERMDAMKRNKLFWKEQMKLEKRRERSMNAGKKGQGSKSTGFGKVAKSSSSSSSSNDNSDANTPPEHTAFNPQLDIEGYAAILREEGVVRKNSVVSLSTTALLRQFIDDELERSNQDIALGKITEPSRFARVLLKQNRWDMSLPFEQEENGGDVIMQALWEMLGDGQPSSSSSSSNPSGTVGHIIESALTSDAKLHELSSLISDPGSHRQILHPDVPHQGDVQYRTGPPFVTCFVAVQDIDSQMGPTEFLPGTNTLLSHDEFTDYDRRDELLRNANVKLSLLKEGDCSIYDTTTLHAGSANKSPEEEESQHKRRRIFYCTFRSLSTDDDRTSDEPGSIRGDVLERRLSLKQIRDILYQWRLKKDQKQQQQQQQQQNHDS